MGELKEVSAKRPVPVIRVHPTKKARDPRFDSFRKFDFHQFSNNYSFLKEKATAEVGLLKKELKKNSNEDLERSLQSMVNKRKNRIAMEKETALKRRIKKEEISKILKGKQPFYHKSEKVVVKSKNKRRKYKKPQAIPLGLK